MEREAFFSGYCRQIDESRMVTAEAEDGTLTSIDCAYETCPHTQSCTVAQKITQFLQD